MSNSKKILVLEQQWSNYFTPFAHLGMKEIHNFREIESNPDSIGLVVFTGGHDVSPSLYGHKKYRTTSPFPERDYKEKAIFELARHHNIPMAGICRGAQFLCVMAGGTLVQDLDNHTTWHKLAYRDDKGNVNISPNMVSSTHHQMQFPWSLPHNDFEVLAWSPSPYATRYVLNDIEFAAQSASDNLKLEPDVVYYKKINALAIQYHPEYMSVDSWGFKWAKSLISKYFDSRVTANV